LNLLVVVRRNRRQGIGRLLHDRFEQGTAMLREETKKSIPQTLEVFEDNSFRNFIYFWRKGYRPISWFSPGSMQKN
jgi:hypothetical protein